MGDRFQVRAAVVGRNGTTRAKLGETGAVLVHGSRVRWERAGLTEEYSATVDGVRQDFIISLCPPGSGSLQVDLEVVGATATPAANGARMTLKHFSRDLAYGRLRAVDFRGRELASRMDVRSATRLVISVDDTGAAYPVRIDPTFSDADWIAWGNAGNERRGICGGGKHKRGPGLCWRAVRRRRDNAGLQHSGMGRDQVVGPGFRTE